LILQSIAESVKIMHIPKIFLKESIVAKPGFNRWLMPPASIAIRRQVVG